MPVPVLIQYPSLVACTQAHGTSSRDLDGKFTFCLSDRRVARAFFFVFVGWQGARLDNDAALQIVEMYINTRGVGLAEAFESKCRKDYGLPPDRRWGTEASWF